MKAFNAILFILAVLSKQIDGREFINDGIVKDGLIPNKESIASNKQTEISEYIRLKKEPFYKIEQNTKKILEKIPSNDKESLDNFFKNLVIFQSLGYVIFGDKPMVWGCLDSNKAFVSLRDPKILSYDRLWDDYLTWKKYQHLFLMENFIFRVFKSSFDENIYYFLFINKNLLLNCIINNMKFFKKKLENSITPEYILSQLNTKENFIEEVFNGNEDLLGLLLGFGKHNSQKFQKRLELKDKYRPPYDKDKIDYFYNVKLTRFPSDCKDDTLLNFILLPYFVEDKNHPESIQVRQKYIDAQKKLCEIYSEGNFLEITLDALIKKN